MFISLCCYSKFTNNNGNNNILELRARELAQPSLFLKRCSLETQISTTSQPAQQWLRQRQRCKAKADAIQSRLSLSLSLTLASALTLFGMSFVAFVLLPLLLLLLLLLYLCLANINSWTAAGSSRAAAVWAGRGIERTNAKCEMRRRRFVQLGHCLCPPL